MKSNCNIFINKIIKTRGNCYGLECKECPIQKSCKEGDTKQTTLVKAHNYLAMIRNLKA
jgi:hypothetical protein